ncbi:MAG: alpha amylase C-terminal domain-containing protein [Kiritimatiellia bacterium]|jgi:1,4-alpha-glucan branching enzyme
MIRDKNLKKLSNDPYLKPHLAHIQERAQRIQEQEERLSNPAGNLADFASAHEYFGLHRTADGGWVFRELAPNATAIWLVGDFSDWKRQDAYQLERIPESDDWSVELPADALAHGQHYRLDMEWPGGGGPRIPAYARRVVQDAGTKLFSAQVWDPRPYVWKHPTFTVPDRDPLIYEAHVGMAQEEPKIGTYTEFREKTLPRIAKAGYNTIQLMAIMEHPYYGSFGYQVANFFACSSRFGTPEELKELIDAAHGLGIAVIMDLVHSHAVLNEVEGIARFDGTRHLYFHDGPRGRHTMWDSACFDYGRIATLHFLLSNCRYWIDEFRFDGFRFDGVTSMLYLHHGLGVDFMHYDQYFDDNVDEDAYTYLALANKVVHAVRPDAITVAEDVSGMPGLCSPAEEGGAGFDLRMAMGVTETWGKLVRDIPDPDWHLSWLWHELVNRRADEQTISYVECHDQALVGGKTLFFEMTGPAIYDAMHKGSGNLAIERAIALHKLARLATLGAAGHGYLNFMGNEFGHPEWIDFPREGNDFSLDRARRQWSLRDDPTLQFHWLGDFDEALMKLVGSQERFFHNPVRFMEVSDGAKILVFSRGPLFFAFNFHWTQSYPDWAITVPPGSYDLVLNSDAPAFGGQGRIADGQTFIPLPEIKGREQIDRIHVYLPARTAVVLKRR